MTIHLQHEIETLKKDILAIGARVEEALRKSIRAFMERDGDLAKKVIDDDADIDRMEVELEEECLKILALHQPVAIDLRFIVAIIKINSDLERIGDLAVNIAERTMYVIERPKIEMGFDYRDMAKKALRMVERSLDSLVNMDAALAREVCASDDEVDELNRAMFKVALESMAKDPENMQVYMRYMLVARHLERIGDHATNIGEDVIYMVEGEIVRHRMGELNPAPIRLLPGGDHSSSSSS